MDWRDYIPRLQFRSREHIPPVERDLRVRATAGDIFNARNNSMVTSGNWASAKHAEYYVTNTVAYAAVKLRADSVASAPLTILTETGEGSEPVGPQHPVQEMFNRVNPWWTHSDLWKATETHLSLFGSAFWFIDKEGESGPEIWPIRADRVQIIPERKMIGRAEMPNAYIKGYMFEANGVRVPLMTDEVVWFRYFNPLDEYGGLSPVAPARLTLDMGHDALRYNRNFFNQGAHPGSLAFSHEDAYTNDQVAEFYVELEKRFGGTSNAHRPLLLTDGLKVQNLGMSQKDMEFLASLQYTVEDAARVWRVWPELLASGTRAAFRNVGEATADFWLSTISNEWSFLETEVTELLIPTLGTRAEGLTAAFDTSTVPALEKARVDENRQNLEAVQSGALTINEWREMQGMEPVEWGDVWWSPSTVFPVSSPDALSMPQAPQAIEPPQEEALKPPSRRGAMKRTVQEKKHKIELIKEMWVKALTRREREFRSLQRNLFRDQEREVVSRIRRLGIQTVDGLQDLIDEEATVTSWMRRAEPLYEDAIVGAAKQTASVWGLRPLQSRLEQERIFNPLDPTDPGFQTWLTERMRWWASRTNQATAQLLRGEIEAGITSGEGIPQIMERVEKVFDFSDAVRSERIARTEMVSAQNRGNLELMSSSGVVEKKRWLTVIDGRTRESHLAANGQVVEIDEKFVVGSDLMDAPGQGSVGGENINCRCVVQPVVNR